MVFKKLRALMIIMLLLTVTVFAGTTGKIRGRVVDEATGEPLAGATVMIEGTSLGAFTQADGNYFILQVPPGIHKVKCMIVGYADYTKENVIVSADTTTAVDFAMEAKVAGREEIIVQAKRPIVQKDNTSSQKVVGAEEIQKLVNPSVEGVLQQQAGVVQDAAGETHVRGGRTGEVSYIIDGIPVNTSLGGGNAFANLQSNVIQEMNIVTGGFNAEYGQAMSGIVKIVTQDAGEKITGALDFQTSQFGDKFFNQFEDNRLDSFLSAPIPFLKKAGILASFSWNTRDGIYNHHPKAHWISEELHRINLSDPDEQAELDDAISKHFPGLATYSIDDPTATTGGRLWKPRNSREEYSLFSKMNFTPLNNMRLAFSYTRQDVNAVPLLSNLNRYEYYYEQEWLNQMASMSLTHTLSPSMFYTINVAYQDNYFLGNTDGRDYTEYPGYDDGTAYQNFHRESYYSSYYYGFYARYQEQSEKIIKAAADLTWQYDNYNQFKAGVNTRFNELEKTFYYPRNQGTPYADYYHIKPFDMALFLQDKIEIEDMIINVGFRMEHYDPKVDYYLDNGLAAAAHDAVEPSGNPLEHPEAYPDEGKKAAEAKSYFMPRLGISYPLSDTGVFHFSYGHFYQYPAYDFLYTNVQRPVMGNGYPIVGNPNLEAQKTIQYEVGYNQGLSDIMGIEFVGYFKEMKDILASYKAADPVSGARYTTYINKDFARVIGMDLTLNKRFADNYSFSATYGFMMAKGNNSDEDAAYLNFLNDEYIPPVATTYTDFDRRHSVTANFFYAFLPKQGPELLGIYPLENTTLSLTLNAESGLPYTRTDSLGNEVGEPNSSRMPWTKTVDLKFTKSFNIYGVQTKLYCESTNLFNWVNILYVDPTTGLESNKQVSDPEEYNTAFEYRMALDYYTEVLDYGLPRQVRLGVELSF